MNSADNSEAPSSSKKWSLHHIQDLFDLPFNDLMFQAQTIHRQHFDANQVQVSTLLSIKTGACPEDCKYCSQSARYKTDIEIERLLQIDKVIAAAKKAREQGSTRFCMGAAWRNPKDRDMPAIIEMITAVKDLGMETCMTLGMLSQQQAHQLHQAGLDYYNHNIDTSPEYYDQIISTRTFQDRLDTLDHVRAAGMKVCSGGIIGMGESHQDRASLLAELANMERPPESVPINMLVKIPGTPLADTDEIDEFDFIKTIAVARILMPESMIRLSAGRESMNEQMQSLCYLAGANSIFFGCKLLTTDNNETHQDIHLFSKLGINTELVENHSKNSGLELAEEKIHSKPLYYDATV